MRTLYLYRDNGRGAPLGKYLIKTTDDVKESDVRKEFGPGNFVVMETGGGLPVKKTPVWIPHAGDEDTGAIETKGRTYIDREYIEARKEIALIKALERDGSGEDRAIELAAKMAEIFSGMRGGGDSKLLDAYVEGQHATPEAAPVDPLAAAVSALGAGGDRGGDWRRAAQVLAAKMQAHENAETTRLAELNSRLTSIENAIRGATAFAPAPEPRGKREMLVATLAQLATAGIEDLSPALTELGASAPDLAAFVLQAPADEIKAVLTEALSEAQAPDLFADWLVGIENFRLRVSGEGDSEISPATATDTPSTVEKTS